VNDFEEVALAEFFDEHRQFDDFLLAQFANELSISLVVDVRTRLASFRLPHQFVQQPLPSAQL